MDNKGSNIWLIIVLILISIFLMVAKMYSYNKYLSYYGQVMEDKTIKILILKEDMDKLTNNLIINKKRKYCITSKVSTSYMLDNNYNKYYEVFYKCDLSNVSDEYIFDIKIDLGKTTIMEEIKNKIKKGFE